MRPRSVAAVAVAAAVVVVVAGVLGCGPAASIDKPCEDDNDCADPTTCEESPPGGHLLFCELHCTSDADCAEQLDANYACFDENFLTDAADGFCHDRVTF